MTKTVSINDLTYADLVSLSGELTALAKKPISLGMTVLITLSTFRYYSKKFSKSTWDMLAKGLASTASPEEWDAQMDEVFKMITKGTI